jgi:hypothetical protein
MIVYDGYYRWILFVLQAILAAERKDTELQTLFYKGLRDLGTDFPGECEI